MEIHFADIRQVKIDPNCSPFTDFGQVIVILLGLGKTLGHEKQSKPSLFDKKIQEPCIGSGTSHFHSITGNQELGSSVNNRLQRFGLLFLFVTCFSDFCDKIKYA